MTKAKFVITAPRRTSQKSLNAKFGDLDAAIRMAKRIKRCKEADHIRLLAATEEDGLTGYYSETY